MKKVMQDNYLNNSFTDELIKSNIQNIDCGYIENSLFGNEDFIIDENGVKNRKIKIFYFIKKSLTKNAPYIVFLNGGPGIAVTDMFFQYQYSSFLPEVNVVFFDQRGNGHSDKPTSDINELKYYSAKYIVIDTEKLREHILGKESKWTIFGQSYGGVIARKYIEYFPNSIKRVITHGSAKYDPIDVAINTELNSLNRLNSFFSKYPEDLVLIKKIKNELLDTDSLHSKIYSIKGKGLIHILAILYSVKSDEDFHHFLSQIDNERSKQSFLEIIKPLSDLILDAGLVNQAVAQIDLIGDISTDEISKKTKETLSLKGISLDNSILSKQLFDDSLDTESDDLKNLESCFKNRLFKTDTVDLDNVVNQCNKYKIPLDVFGGLSDSLAINSIKNEEIYIKSKFSESSCINYHYSKGHHREWLTNYDAFNKLILEC